MVSKILDIKGNLHEIDFDNFQSEFINCDCMEALKELPDKCIDLAIVDPPYFKGVEKENYFGNKVSASNVKRLNKPLKHWDIPDNSYFKQLFRVSKNQIIWGSNYYDFIYPRTGRIIWDKQNDSSTFSNCEIAYCSLHDSVKIFRYLWNGMLQGDMRNKDFRIHPTQKPVALYEWLLSRYAKEGDIIPDTHVGSASSLVACHKTNHKFLGFEIDETYYKAAKERLDAEVSQMNIFNFIGG